MQAKVACKAGALLAVRMSDPDWEAIEAEWTASRPFASSSRSKSKWWPSKKDVRAQKWQRESYTVVFKGQIACWIVAQQAMAYHACWNERAFILCHHASYITVCQGNLKCKELLKGFWGYHQNALIESFEMSTHLICLGWHPRSPLWPVLDQIRVAGHRRAWTMEHVSLDT